MIFNNFVIACYDDSDEKADMQLPQTLNPKPVAGPGVRATIVDFCTGALVSHNPASPFVTTPPEIWYFCTLYVMRTPQQYELSPMGSWKQESELSGYP